MTPKNASWRPSVVPPTAATCTGKEKKKHCPATPHTQQMTVSFARTTSVRITVQRVSVATRNKPAPLKQVGRGGARRRGVCTPFFFREIETESLLLLVKYRDLALLCSQSKKRKT